MTLRPADVDFSPLFNSERLTLARQLAGVRKSALAKKAGVSPAAITAWEAGTRVPTKSNINALALALGTSVSFLAAPASDNHQTGLTPHFRSLRSTSQIARDQATAYGSLVVDVANTFESEFNFPALDLPAYPVEPDEVDAEAPKKAARLLREKWGLGDAPITHVVRTVENHGVVVVFSPPQTRTIDAYSFNSGTRPVIVLNPHKRDYYRQRFDTAHELGHLIMHFDAEPGNKNVEDQAHQFASEFLAPSKILKTQLPTQMGREAWIKLATLKERWGMSIQALLFQARALGCITPTTYRNAMMTLTSRGWRRTEPGAITALEEPSIFPGALKLLETEQGQLEIIRQKTCAPKNLFDVITARKPRSNTPSEAPSTETGQSAKVVSLLPKLEKV